MKEKLRQYVELLFAGAANNEKNNELREELLGNLYDRYDDFLASGMSEEEAYNKSIASIGDLSELLEESRQGQSAEEKATESVKEKIPLYGDEEIQKKKKLFPILHAVAVALYILCVIPAMILNSNISAALMFVLVAAATAIFIYTAYAKPVLVSADIRENERETLAKNKHRAGIMRAAGVALYITCVCPVIIWDSTVSIVLMFAIIAVATAMMILTSSLFPTNVECEPQFESGSNDKIGDKNNSSDSTYKLIERIINAVFWALVFILYFAISFATNRWWMTWLIFPIAGLISGIISGIFNLIRSRRIAGSIVGICICSALLFGLLPAFNLTASIEDFPLSFVSSLSADSSFFADDDDTDYDYGNTQISADGISAIDIYWVAGSVNVELWSEDYIDVCESGRNDDSPENALHSKVDGGRLIIKFSEEQKRGVFRFGKQESKELTVKIPESEILKALEINSISSDIVLNELSGIDLDVTNVSGRLTAQSCFFGEIDAEAVSGDIELSGGCRSLDISMVSGNVKATFQSVPEEISVETVSGNIELILPDDISGFTLSSEAISDKVVIEYPTERKNDKHIFGDGSTRIDIEAVSGKITVK
ncbi:MAG: DUF4097 family beta strand repeat protein [Clostridia bacterium]|nr:DUF4097 family beta strand repeat protein [Clostridia bacterium]